jgi:hypothetical protein
MKKTLLHIAACFPLICLGVFYLARIVFHMGDGNIWGMIMIFLGAFLSFLTPFFLTLIALSTETMFKLRYHFVSCGLAGVLYWLLCFLDLGKQLHKFIAA